RLLEARARAAMKEESDGPRLRRPTFGAPARQLCCAMGGFGTPGCGREEGELSWTNEALPLEVRRALLDKALDDLRRAKAAGASPAGKTRDADRAGVAGSDRESNRGGDKPGRGQ
ncbi:MAG: hypothetical protein NDJ19_16790, partial [Ramlibacter sp.]|nr:hypothetical protein [Ramlibacter sp.]